MDRASEVANDKLRAVVALIKRIDEAIGVRSKEKRSNASKPRATAAKARMPKSDPNSEGGSNQARAA
jgi:hypothetical protein